MFHAIAVAQIGTFLILQANIMDRRIGCFHMPAGSIGVFSILALTIWMPVYDRLVLPLARRLTGQDRGITFLQRIGVGCDLGTLAMVLSGLVEAKRRRVARSSGLIDKPGEMVPMSVFWLAPQVCLIGLAEAFNGIGLTEFYYDQIPKSMRSTAGAFGWCSYGIGVYISSVLLTIVSEVTSKRGTDNWLADNLNRVHLDYFYYLIAGLLAFNLISFLVCTRWYAYTRLTDRDEEPIAESCREV